MWDKCFLLYLKKTLIQKIKVAETLIPIFSNLSSSFWFNILTLSSNAMRQVCLTLRYFKEKQIMNQG